MSGIPRYALRFARLPEVIARLEGQDRPLTLTELGAMVGADPDELRRDIEVFANLDTGMYRDRAVWLSSIDGQLCVQMRSQSPAGELGVQLFTGEELATIYRTGQDVLEAEPANQVLASALAKLAEAALPAAEVFDEAAPGRGLLSDFALAVDQQRKVAIEYSAAWQTSITERVIEPYALTHTRRGWEVDAGPVRSNHRIRTFLLAQVRAHTVLPERFELPADAVRLIEANRRTTKATLLLPPRSDWVVERFAEQSTVVRDEAGEKEIEVEVLEPVAERLGLMVLIAGPGAMVVEPPQYRDADVALARTLSWRYRDD
jgi:proteasome accessory factor C